MTTGSFVASNCVYVLHEQRTNTHGLRRYADHQDATINAWRLEAPMLSKRGLHQHAYQRAIFSYAANFRTRES
jgi:hypothetical protein